MFKKKILFSFLLLLATMVFIPNSVKAANKSYPEIHFPEAYHVSNGLYKKGNTDISTNSFPLVTDTEYAYKIEYNAEQLSGPANIYLSDLNGNNILTIASVNGAGGASWSPNGSVEIPTSVLSKGEAYIVVHETYVSSNWSTMSHSVYVPTVYYKSKPKGLSADGETVYNYTGGTATCNPRDPSYGGGGSFNIPTASGTPISIDSKNAQVGTCSINITTDALDLTKATAVTATYGGGLGASSCETATGSHTLSAVDALTGTTIRTWSGTFTYTNDAHSTGIIDLNEDPHNWSLPAGVADISNVYFRLQVTGRITTHDGTTRTPRPAAWLIYRGTPITVKMPDNEVIKPTADMDITFGGQSSAYGNGGFVSGPNVTLASPENKVYDLTDCAKLTVDIETTINGGGSYSHSFRMINAKTGTSIVNKPTETLDNGTITINLIDLKNAGNDLSMVRFEGNVTAAAMERVSCVHKVSDIHVKVKSVPVLNGNLTILIYGTF